MERIDPAQKRILRYLEKKGVISFAAAPGDGEVNAQVDETLAKLRYAVGIFPGICPE
jgi:hypothetical protein